MTIEIGFSLSSEEHTPADLVRQAIRAEEVGFSFARKTACQIWPNAAIVGQLAQDLPTPKHFEDAAGMVHEEDLAEKLTQEQVI